jgi:hypothetical protein
MTARERRLYQNVLGDETAVVLLLTESTIEVGLLFWRSRVWLCATANCLLLFASGRRPLIQKVPFAHIQESLYNHVTGALVLAPNRKYKLAQVQLPPLAAYQVLAQIYTYQPGQQKAERSHA